MVLLCAGNHKVAVIHPCTPPSQVARTMCIIACMKVYHLYAREPSGMATLGMSDRMCRRQAAAGRKPYLSCKGEGALDVRARCSRSELPNHSLPSRLNMALPQHSDRFTRR